MEDIGLEFGDWQTVYGDDVLDIVRSGNDDRILELEVFSKKGKRPIYRQEAFMSEPAD